MKNPFFFYILQDILTKSEAETFHFLLPFHGVFRAGWKDRKKKKCLLRIILPCKITPFTVLPLKFQEKGCFCHARIFFQDLFTESQKEQFLYG